MRKHGSGDEHQSNQQILNRVYAVLGARFDLRQFPNFTRSLD
jgi:hypothetical protein